MRRAFFFIVAVCLATSSFASIPRASAPDLSSPSFDALPETRIRVSEDLALFERPAPSLLSRALRQAYEQASTTNASGLAGFLSVDPEMNPEKIKYEPQQWNRYSYVTNNPLKYTDPDGKDKFMAWLLGDAFRDVNTMDALKGAFGGDAGPAMSQAAGDWAEDHRQMTGGFSPVPTSKTEVAMLPVLMMLGPAGKTAFNGIITSAVKNDTLLIKAAQFAGKSHQGSIDNLVGALAKGNLNPGIGTKNLFGNVMYARARDGARVFFRQGRDGSIEILAKANKANEKQVIKRLEDLYK